METIPWPKFWHTVHRCCGETDQDPDTLLGALLRMEGYRHVVFPEFDDPDEGALLELIRPRWPKGQALFVCTDESFPQGGERPGPGPFVVQRNKARSFADRHADAFGPGWFSGGDIIAVAEDASWMFVYHHSAHLAF